MKNRVVVVGVVWAVILGSIAYAQEPASKKSERSVPGSVCRIVVSDIRQRQDSVIATGFLWPDNRHVLTAFHVILAADGKVISAQNEKSGISVNVGGIVRVLPAADMALLKLEVAMDGIPEVIAGVGEFDLEGLYGKSKVPSGLSSSEQQVALPSVQDKLRCWSYRRASQGVHNTPLEVSAKPAGLNRLLSKEAISELAAYGFPSLGNKVLIVDGELRPGSSGAPVFNTSVQPVAIVSGGEKRAGGIAWAIPLMPHVQTLLKSKIVASDYSSPSGLWYSESIFDRANMKPSDEGMSSSRARVRPSAQDVTEMKEQINKVCVYHLEVCLELLPRVVKSFNRVPRKPALDVIQRAIDMDPWPPSSERSFRKRIVSYMNNIVEELEGTAPKDLEQSRFYEDDYGFFLRPGTSNLNGYAKEVYVPVTGNKVEIVIWRGEVWSGQHPKPKQLTHAELIAAGVFDSLDKFLAVAMWLGNDHKNSKRGRLEDIDDRHEAEMLWRNWKKYAPFWKEEGKLR